MSLTSLSSREMRKSCINYVVQEMRARHTEWSEYSMNEYDEQWRDTQFVLSEQIFDVWQIPWMTRVAVPITDVSNRSREPSGGI